MASFDENAKVEREPSLGCTPLPRDRNSNTNSFCITSSSLLCLLQANMPSNMPTKLVAYKVYGQAECENRFRLVCIGCSDTGCEAWFVDFRHMIGFLEQRHNT